MLDDGTPCRCQTNNAEAFMALAKEFLPVRVLHDESHFCARIFECGACGQRFLRVFSERIDWVNGEDPQWVGLVALGPEQERLLESLPAELNFADLNGLQLEGRIATWDHPSDREAHTRLYEGAFFVPPHD